jgi:molybdopterin-guanine dinucleotide biosynthesis protein A
MKKTDITGIILAGGQSSRLGTDKAFIKIGNKTLIENTYEVITDYCKEVLISANNHTGHSFPEQRIIPDYIPGLGPIGGIYSCLKHSGTENNLVVAVDIPFINKGLIQFLISDMADAELIIPISGDGKAEPLCALYKKSVLPHLEKMIAKKDLKVQNLTHYCKSKKLPVSHKQGFYHDRLFYNINTPDDLYQLTK